MKISEKKITEFKKAFGGMDFGHGLTWTDEGVTTDGFVYYGYQDPYVAVFFDNYYVFIYLNDDGDVLVEWAYGDDETGCKMFKATEYEKAKEYILNYIDNSEKEND